MPKELAGRAQASTIRSAWLRDLQLFRRLLSPADQHATPSAQTALVRKCAACADQGSRAYACDQTAGPDHRHATIQIRFYRGDAALPATPDQAGPAAAFRQTIPCTSCGVAPKRSLTGRIARLAFQDWAGFLASVKLASGSRYGASTTTPPALPERGLRVASQADQHHRRCCRQRLGQASVRQ